jgi:hypothetical protein
MDILHPISLLLLLLLLLVLLLLLLLLSLLLLLLLLLFTAIGFAPGGSSPTLVQTKTIKQHYTVVLHNKIKRKQQYNKTQT